MLNTFGKNTWSICTAVPLLNFRFFHIFFSAAWPTKYLQTGKELVLGYPKPYHLQQWSSSHFLLLSSSSYLLFLSSPIFVCICFWMRILLCVCTALGRIGFRSAAMSIWSDSSNHIHIPSVEPFVSKAVTWASLTLTNELTLYN